MRAEDACTALGLNFIVPHRDLFAPVFGFRELEPFLCLLLVRFLQMNGSIWLVGLLGLVLLAVERAVFHLELSCKCSYD